MTYDSGMENPQQNLPLTDVQKLAVRNLQHRLMKLQIESNDASQKLQEELRRITRANAINFEVFSLTDDLELAPIAPVPPTA